MSFNVLDLFSGIGGFSLGLERAGMRTVAFCEIDLFCREVLAKNWPAVRIFPNVCELTAEYLAATASTGDIAIDVICGGFPCQDISIAGNGLGLDGERSGLWREYFRLIREIRPRFALIENTAALLGRGLSRVLCDLASIGYDAQWDVIPAVAIGAQHLRERVWIVAYPNDKRELQLCGGEQNEWGRANNGYQESYSSDAMPSGLSRGCKPRENGGHASYLPARTRLAELAEKFDYSYWRYPPLMGRGVHGISNRLDRVGALGNAVVPQIPEEIGRAIIKATGERT